MTKQHNNNQSTTQSVEDKSTATLNVSDVVGKNLKTIIKKYNITQGELARKIGYLPSTVNDYFNCRTMPKIDFLIALKNEFGISIDDLCTKTINEFEFEELPQDNNTALDAEQESYRKFCGSYYIYYFDTSNYKGRDNNDESESLRFGILYIYENPSTLAEPTYNCLAAMGIKSREEAVALKKTFDKYEHLEAAIDCLAHAECVKSIYSGDFTLSQRHAFLQLSYGEKDKALAILHRPDSSQYKKVYTGGLGTINSVSKGREPMPTIQFIGLTRNDISLSDEEIHHTLLLSYPTFKAHDQAEELIATFKNLYMGGENGTENLSEFDKSITIRANLEHYIKQSLEQNMFRYSKISNRDDDDWYHTIKEYRVIENNE